MTCPQCGQESPAGSRFCNGCGAKLEVGCPACGHANPASSRFCNGCGQPLAGGGSSASSRSPESYTPKHLAERILTSKAALEGERKQVTVLFADLKGSMELLADRDPEEARTILDPVLEHMMEAVHRYEGTVNQVMGDGIMALFGAPLAHEDHAVRACYAALRMQESVKRYGEGVRRVEGVPIRIRVGLNSGEVLVRAIGSDLHMDYTAVGQTTHLAARMEQMADPGSILMTADSLSLAEGYIQVKSLGPLPVKGLGAPVEVYEVVGTEAVRSRLHATAARGLTQFVGRDPEMEQLRLALDRAKGGHGQVVAVIGEPGVGKSRLYWEFTHSHRTDGWLVLESRSLSYGKATSYLPVIDLLKAYFQIEARDERRRVREKVTGKLLSLDEALRPALPALLALLDLPVEDATWQALDPPQRRQRTLDAIKRLLLRESQVQPMMVVFEDLHWIDSETQALLDSLLESLPTARLLLLVNYRPEYQHGWGSKTYYRQLQIAPLAPESADALLRGLLGGGAALESLRSLLIPRTGGNPFFLEESVRTLVETGVLAGERGSYRLAREPANIQVPSTVQAVLAARIDRLPPEGKRLLQTAAIIGKDVPFPLLEAIVDIPEGELRRSLTNLQAGEFLYEARLFPELEYTFKHALTQEVAYMGLSKERRRTLDAAIVEAIERQSAERLGEHVERLALHALRGEVWEKAVVYSRHAGSKALTRSTNREAAGQFDRALKALSHLPVTRGAVEQGIDLRFDLRNAIWPLGDFEETFQHLLEAERLAKTLDDDRRLAWISVYTSQYLWAAGRNREAVVRAQAAYAMAETLGDLPLRVAANYYLAVARMASGDYRRAEQNLKRVIELLPDSLNRERCGLAGFPVVLARSFLAWALAELGKFEEGMQYGDEAVQLAETLGHPYSLIIACIGLGCLYGIAGDLEHATQVLQRGLAGARDLGIPLVLPHIIRPLGYIHVLAGRVTEGSALLEQALSTAESIRMRVLNSMTVVYLGAASLLAGKLADAGAYGARALTLARQHDERGYEAWALRLLGEIAACGEPVELEKAEDYYHQAAMLANELGMSPLVAHCHAGLAKVYRREDDRTQAKDHWRIASTMYREMGMTFWLERMQTELGELS